MSVAMTTASTAPRPFHSSRDSANPHMLFTTSPSTTISVVISTELSMNRATGTRSNTSR